VGGVRSPTYRRRRMSSLHRAEMREGQLGRILRAYSVPARTRAGWLLHWAHFGGRLAGSLLDPRAQEGSIEKDGSGAPGRVGCSAWGLRFLGLGWGASDRLDALLMRGELIVLFTRSTSTWECFSWNTYIHISLGSAVRLKRGRFGDNVHAVTPGSYHVSLSCLVVSCCF
jgi:hypothetical protein